jgi:hypothetical protein
MFITGDFGKVTLKMRNEKPGCQHETDFLTQKSKSGANEFGRFFTSVDKECYFNLRLRAIPSV